MGQVSRHFPQGEPPHRATAEGEAKGQADTSRYHLFHHTVDTKCCFTLTALPVNQKQAEIGSSEVSFYLREQRHLVKKHFIITESKKCVA